jgi:REP element-mobilizing transposase RayT
MKGECCRVGGTDDHVHLVVRLHRAVSVSDLVEQLKTDSSKWMKADGVPTFSWQRGYGAPSLGSSALRPLVEYVEDQTQHHRRRCFQDELRALLAEEGVEFDERYLWD